MLRFTACLSTLWPRRKACQVAIKHHFLAANVVNGTLDFIRRDEVLLRHEVSVRRRA